VWPWEAPGHRSLSKQANPPAWLSQFLDDEGRNALQTGRVLDAGFEDGSGARAFLAAGYQKVYAVDSDERCRPMLQEEVDAGRAEVHIGQIQEVELPSGMDVVYAHYLLPFVVDDLPSTLRRFSNATRPGGYLICGFMGMDHSWKGRTGISLYSEEQLRELLTEAGYTNIQIFPRRFEKVGVQGGDVVPVWDGLIVRAQTAATIPLGSGSNGDAIRAQREPAAA
jgi:SAM-dependent methyltransferase